jgi:hypothetical protein
MVMSQLYVKPGGDLTFEQQQEVRDAFASSGFEVVEFKAAPLAFDVQIIVNVDLNVQQLVAAIAALVGVLRLRRPLRLGVWKGERIIEPPAEDPQVLETQLRELLDGDA